MANRTAYSAPLAFPGRGWARSHQVLGGAVAILAADLVTGNTVGLFKVQKGFNLIGVSGYIPSLDSNVSKTVAFTLGDATTANRIIASSTIAQAGGLVATSNMQTSAVGYNFPADTEIVLTFGTGSATAAAGTIYLYLHGYFD
ncbi:MAG: hypothetical protein JSS66_18990 [Armatimonadetes bacterium]|nr:hypothetical protein [Armatimonadota bacterium]